MADLLEPENGPVVETGESQAEPTEVPDVSETAAPETGVVSETPEVVSEVVSETFPEESQAAPVTADSALDEGSGLDETDAIAGGVKVVKKRKKKTKAGMSNKRFYGLIIAGLVIGGLLSALYFRQSFAYVGASREQPQVAHMSEPSVVNMEEGSVILPDGTFKKGKPMKQAMADFLKVKTEDIVKYGELGGGVDKDGHLFVRLASSASTQPALEALLGKYKAAGPCMADVRASKCIMVRDKTVWIDRNPTTEVPLLSVTIITG